MCRGPETAYHWRHGWRPRDVATALLHGKKKLAEQLHKDGAGHFNAEPSWWWKQNPHLKKTLAIGKRGGMTPANKMELLPAKRKAGLASAKPKATPLAQKAAGMPDILPSQKNAGSTDAFAFQKAVKTGKAQFVTGKGQFVTGKAGEKVVSEVKPKKGLYAEYTPDGALVMHNSTTGYAHAASPEFVESVVGPHFAGPQGKVPSQSPAKPKSVTEPGGDLSTLSGKATKAPKATAGPMSFFSAEKADDFASEQAKATGVPHYSFEYGSKTVVADTVPPDKDYIVFSPDGTKSTVKAESATATAGPTAPKTTPEPTKPKAVPIPGKRSKKGALVVQAPAGTHKVGDQIEVTSPKGNVHAVEVTGVGKEFPVKGVPTQYHYVKSVTPKDVTPAEPAVPVASVANAVPDKPTSGKLSAADRFDPIDATGWTQVGPQKGSNAGGTYADASGAQHYVKIPKSEKHARNEALAAQLYAMTGIEHSDLRLAKVGDGKIGTASPVIPGAKADLAAHLSDPDYKATVQEGFATDVWLANWDVVGLGHDNIVTDATGKPVRVDPGGALLFRAQGGKKGPAFTAEANEWDTLRDAAKNPQAASVFAGMTDQQLRDSAQKVVDVSPGQIDEVVKASGLDPIDQALVATRLKERRADIAKRAGIPLPEAGDQVAAKKPQGVTAAEALVESAATEGAFAAPSVSPDLAALVASAKAAPDLPASAMPGNIAFQKAVKSGEDHYAVGPAGIFGWSTTKPAPGQTYIHYYPNGAAEVVGTDGTVSPVPDDLAVAYSKGVFPAASDSKKLAAVGTAQATTGSPAPYTGAKLATVDGIPTGQAQAFSGTYAGEYLASQKPALPTVEGLGAHYKANAAAFGSGERAAAQKYTSNWAYGSGSVNQKLRKGTPLSDADAKTVELIDKAMTRYSAPTTLYVKRGFTPFSGADFPTENLAGKVYEDAGFVSTSVGKSAFGGSVRMNILVPKGTPGISTKGAGIGVESEGEFILPRGTRVLVQKDDTVAGTRFITAIVVPSPESTKPPTHGVVAGGGSVKRGAYTKDGLSYLMVHGREAWLRRYGLSEQASGAPARVPAGAPPG